MQRMYLLGPMLALVLALAAGCKKNDPEATLPPATDEGKNVGGCLIDGVVWQTSSSHGSVWGGPGTAAVVSKKAGQGFYNVSIILSSGQSSRTIELKCKNTLGYGRCEFNTTLPPVTSPEPSYAQYRNGAAPGIIGKFTTSPSATGWMDITYLDTQKSIIAGRFAFTGQDAVSGREVVISEGRFDTICYYIELP